MHSYTDGNTRDSSEDESDIESENQDTNSTSEENCNSTGDGGDYRKEYKDLHDHRSRNHSDPARGVMTQVAQPLRR